jgi:hypothetical protein
MKFVYSFLFLLFITTACKKDDTGCGSACIDREVETFKSKTLVCDQGASVKEYLFQGKPVYVFEIGPCVSDTWSDVKDAQCNHLGMLGGIAGFTKINGVEFSSNAVYQRTLWSN